VTDAYEDDPRKAYNELRQKFAGVAGAELKSGAWLVKMVQWVLETHAKEVDAAYLTRKYPGAGPVNQAKKAIGLASKYAAVVGGASATAVTALEFSIPLTAGLDTAIAVPIIGTAILADVLTTTRVQLRTTYDLSVIHGVPLDVDDVEDCYLVFTTAMGISLAEGAGDLVRTVSPKIVAFNVRKMLRAGLRGALVKMITKIAGTQASKKITEKALMRLLVPGLSIPISAGMSYAFTRSILESANRRMLRRGAVILPLAQLYQQVPDLPRDAALRALITVIEAPKREGGWDERQLDALRHTQSALKLDDDAVAVLEGWFDRTPDDVASGLPQMTERGGRLLVEYLATAAALGSQAQHDVAYAAAIGKIAAPSGAPFDAADIASIRRRLA